MTEDEIPGWHHWLDGRESEWTPGVGDGQGGLACCNSWGRRVGHNWATELNWTELNWLDLCAVQGTLKSLLQQQSSKASILLHSAFFIVQLSHPYMTIWKTIALTRWTFVGKVMSFLFNMLSQFVIVFLPRSKCLLISWLKPPFAVILEPNKIRSVTVSILSQYICHEVMGPNATTFVFWMLSYSQRFPFLFHYHQEALSFFAFCHKVGVVCISEVIDISPRNLNSSLCFLQPSFSHDILCI